MATLTVDKLAARISRSVSLDQPFRVFVRDRGSFDLFVNLAEQDDYTLWLSTARGEVRTFKTLDAVYACVKDLAHRSGRRFELRIEGSSNVSLGDADRG